MAVNYINNKDFLAALVAYKKKKIEYEAAGKPEPRIPEYIGRCFMKIADNLSTKGNFVNYPFKQDMISDGLENCVKYMHNFNPEKSPNAFAYFTRIIWNAFILRIGKEKKELYVKYKTHENNILAGMGDFGDRENTTDVKFTDNVNSFITDFEKKLSDKKPAKKKGIEEFIDGD
jgi:hypothetical protein